MPVLPLLPPNRHIDRSKIEDYLLHPINGRGKAAFFEAYGFSLAEWDVLRNALLEPCHVGPLDRRGCVTLWHPLHCPRRAADA